MVNRAGSGQTRAVDLDGTGERPVVVAVSPRLLADAVRRALGAVGVATVDVSDAAAVAADVAVVSPGREPDVHVRTVLTLSEDAEPSPRPDRVVDLAGLHRALASLRRPESG